MGHLVSLPDQGLAVLFRAYGNPPRLFVYGQLNLQHPFFAQSHGCQPLTQFLELWPSGLYLFS